jgi:hypothetical protein
LDQLSVRFLLVRTFSLEYLQAVHFESGQTMCRSLAISPTTNATDAITPMTITPTSVLAIEAKLNPPREIPAVNAKNWPQLFGKSGTLMLR